VADGREAELAKQPPDLARVQRPGGRRLERQIDEIESRAGDRAQLVGNRPSRVVHQAEPHRGGFRSTPRRYIRGMEPEIRRLAESVSERLVDQGAQATLLTRGQLTVQLAELFAVRRRLMEESENGFWETVAEAGGPDWHAALERALGVERDEADAAAGGWTCSGCSRKTSARCRTTGSAT
jgi:hypothetical protein